MANVFFVKEKRRMKLLISRQDGYSMIAANISWHFQAIFHMPMKLDPAQSDEGCGIEETLPSCCRIVSGLFSFIWSWNC